MNETDIKNSLGCCGKVCKLCKDAVFCKGCQSNDPACALHRKREGCHQYYCCQKKGIKGCWECDEAPCDLGVFAGSEKHMLRVTVRLAKYDGEDTLASCIFKNQMKGIFYPWNYAYCKSEEEVEKLLEKNMD